MVEQRSYPEGGDSTKVDPNKSAEAADVLRRLADRIANRETSWIPISGDVVNLTLSLAERDLVVSALEEYVPENHSVSVAQTPILRALKVAQAYLMEEANSGSVWSSIGNAKALVEIEAAISSISSTARSSQIDHSGDECPNFPGCHCVDHCCDGWKHPSPEHSSTPPGSEP